MMIEYEGSGVNEIIISVAWNKGYVKHPMEKSIGNGAQVD